VIDTAHDVRTKLKRQRLRPGLGDRTPSVATIELDDTDCCYVRWSLESGDHIALKPEHVAIRPVERAYVVVAVEVVGGPGNCDGIQ
jgi:hypothetical protein